MHVCGPEHMKKWLAANPGSLETADALWARLPTKWRGGGRKNKVKMAKQEATLVARAASAAATAAVAAIRAVPATPPTAAVAGLQRVTPATALANGATIAAEAAGGQ